MPGTPTYTSLSPQQIIQWSTEITARYYRNMHPIFQPNSGNPLVGVGGREPKAIVYKGNLKKGRGEEIIFQNLWDVAVPFLDATEALEGKEVTAQDNTFSVKIGHIRGGTRWNLLFDLQKVQHNPLRHQAWALALAASQLHYFRYLGHLMAFRAGTKASPISIAASSDWLTYQNQQVDMSSSVFFGGQEPTPADDDHHYRCGSLTQGTTKINTDEDANVLKLKKVDLDVISARTSEADPPLISPLMINGFYYYPFLLDLAGINTLKEDTDYSQAIHDFSLQGGEIKENPFFTGAIGRYQRLVFVEIEKSPPGLNSTTGATLADRRRGVVLGVNSLFIACGASNSPANMWFLVTGVRDGKQTRWYHAHSMAGCGSPEYENVHDLVKRDHGKIVVTYKFTDFKKF